MRLSRHERDQAGLPADERHGGAGDRARHGPRHHLAPGRGHQRRRPDARAHADQGMGSGAAAAMLGDAATTQTSGGTECLLRSMGPYLTLLSECSAGALCRTTGGCPACVKQSVTPMFLTSNRCPAQAFTWNGFEDGTTFMGGLWAGRTTQRSDFATMVRSPWNLPSCANRCALAAHTFWLCTRM